jgi:hypothetical protein
MFCRKNWRQRCHHRRKKLTPQDVADLSQPITIESRGGKIANSHDGLTFFYTRLPTSQNFILQATVTVNQFGPENGARPAAQEGAGLLVRDVIGVPRQQPLKVGYEEFPAASNMVMNAIMTQDKKDGSHIKLQTISREGITQPWGNAGASIKRQSYKENRYPANADVPAQTGTHQRRVYYLMGSNGQ